MVSFGVILAAPLIAGVLYFTGAFTVVGAVFSYFGFTNITFPVARYGASKVAGHDVYESVKAGASPFYGKSLFFDHIKEVVFSWKTIAGAVATVSITTLILLALWNKLKTTAPTQTSSKQVPPKQAAPIRAAPEQPAI